MKARDVPGVLVQVTCDVMLPIMLLHIVLGVTCARDVFFYCAERKIVLTEGQARATSNWFVLGCVPQPTVMLCVRSLRITHNTQWHTRGDKLQRYAG